MRGLWRRGVEGGGAFVSLPVSLFLFVCVTHRFCGGAAAVAVAAAAVGQYCESSLGWGGGRDFGDERARQKKSFGIERP